MPEVIKNYLLVTKPGIIFGNLVSAAGGFFLASRGRIDIAVLLSTLIGISLVVASGCVFNNCVDRNMDRKMTRTRNRVLARGLMSPRAAVFYASLLGIAGTALLWAATNMLCVAIVLTGFAIYVGVYSLYLKRNSVLRHVDRQPGGGRTSPGGILRGQQPLRHGGGDIVVDLQPMADSPLLRHRHFPI